MCAAAIFAPATHSHHNGRSRCLGSFSCSLSLYIYCHIFFFFFFFQQCSMWVRRRILTLEFFKFILASNLVSNFSIENFSVSIRLRKKKCKFWCVYENQFRNVCVCVKTIFWTIVSLEMETLYRVFHTLEITTRSSFPVQNWAFKKKNKNFFFEFFLSIQVSKTLRDKFQTKF